jgi:arylsulfatase
MLDKPNILFLFPDQLRADYLGCYGAAFAKTPNIDQLCGESIQYLNAISPAPICIAARASLLTGHNAIKTGIYNNDQWLRPDHSECGMPTWPELLSKDGYHTEGIGKMHFYPWDILEGFDHRVIAEDKRHLDIHDDYAEYLAKKGLKKLHGSEAEGYHENKGAACSPLPREDQVDYWVAEKTVDFIDNYDNDKPFACMVGFPGPHCPYDPPEDIASMFEAADMPDSIEDNEVSEFFKKEFVNGMKQSWNGVDYSEFSESQKKKVKAYYCALIHQIDEGIGKIISKLKEKGLYDNTVIILASDHGDFVGDYGLTGKSYFLSPATDIPLLIRLPEGKHKQVSEHVSLTDVCNTILSMGGVEVNESPDSIVLPEIPGSKTKRDYFFAVSHKGYMVLKGKYKYVRYYAGLQRFTDMETDPTDMNNIINEPENSHILAELKNIMATSIDESIQFANLDKTVERGGLCGEGPFGQKKWQRTYPSGLNSFKTHI